MLLLSGYVRARVITPELLLSLAAVAGSIGQQVREHGSFACLPATVMANVCNGMYLASETIRHIEKEPSLHFDADTRENLSTFKREVDNATKFILLWVKVVVQLHPAWVRWWAVPDASSLVDKVSGHWWIKYPVRYRSFGDGDTGGTCARQVGHRHLKQQVQHLKCIAIPAGLLPLGIHCVMPAM